ncbi:hypothetical protein DTO063F5_1940 [Paecilomyces variotii]|nr:hypothetical protein DTO063F5_1940 [Paecilomyces variotii]
MESINAIANPAGAAPGGGDGGRGGSDRGRGGRGGRGPKKAKRNRNLCTYCKRRGHGYWDCDFYNGVRAMGRQFTQMRNERGRGRGRGRGSAQGGRGRGGLLARGGHQGQLPGGQNQTLSAEANAGQTAPQPEQALADFLAAMSTLAEEERERMLRQAFATANLPLRGHGEEPKDGPNGDDANMGKRP